MRCYFCSAPDSKVIDSRPTVDGQAIRRRRECLSCARRFTTYEKVETVPLVVVKRDGSREPFDAEKIKLSVMKAIDKRRVSMSSVNKLAEEIEQSFQNTLEQEIPTSKVGELVMRKLKELDDVAYVRFASVYRSFEDIDTFKRQLEELLQEREMDDSQGDSGESE
ncbi:MAG: transcriptional regulator NrdR [Christensenellales bacterium]|jgi:transcriptional repressor NrdR